MRTYPTNTANRNVPANSFLIAETSQMSGEIITTYYATKDGSLWKVTDWKSDKPSPAYPFEVLRLTGDGMNVLTGRVESLFRNSESK